MALRAAEEGVVMLLNRPRRGQSEPLLPLPPTIKKIAVLGPNGGCARLGPEVKHS